jgi:NAD+ synthetase
MKISLHQLNTTVGDFSGNMSLILDGARTAIDAGAALAIFPELCLTGYPPLDLLENRFFTEAASEAMDSLLAASSGLRIDLIFGTIITNESDTGKPLSNCAVHCRAGKVVGIHRKVLLPTYDVFDESRYFESGKSLHTVSCGGRDLALSICEDAWNDKTYWSRSMYPDDPVEQLLEGNSLPLINMASSPYSRGKGSLRIDMLGHIARRFRVPVLYVNQAGGNDSLVFDGRSMVIGPDGRVIRRAAAFEPDMLLADLEDLDNTMPLPVEADALDTLFQALVTGVRDYAAKCGFSSAVLGLSGGIDSALTAAVAAEALGPERVTGVLMPSPFSSEGSVSDSLKLAANLGINTRTVPIKGIYKRYLSDLEAALDGLPADVTEENIQARIRGNILMAMSNRFGHLVLSTGNKSELATGYCTLYGDMSGGLAVISDLYKHEVYELSAHLNRGGEVIPMSILTKEPSAELRPEQKDSDSLPPYDLLDPVLKAYLEDNRTVNEIVGMGYDEGLVTSILALVEGNEYKRQQAAPGIKVSWKAFGIGRRCPIAKARLF